MLSDYLKIPKKLRRAILRGEEILVVELYKPYEPDIFWKPDQAVFRFATERLRWQMLEYKPKLLSIPKLSKFMNKEFNICELEINNREVGRQSGSYLALNTKLKGLRVAVRVIAKGLSIEESWHIWSGRLDNVSNLSDEAVTLNCSQELGNFSYKVGTEKFGQSCPLIFGFGDCLGNETLGEKSSRYQRDWELYGFGGCNHTEADCDAKQNSKYYQGLRKASSSGTFFIKVVKKYLWGLFKKVTNVPKQWSSRSQNDEGDETVPMSFGLTSHLAKTFVQADKGNYLEGLCAVARGGKYGIEDIVQIKSGDSQFPITSYTPHFGRLGGEEGQLPDIRFPEVGHNSRLVYAGVTCADNSAEPLSDTPKDFPPISMILKGNKIQTPHGVMWSVNPVYVVLFFLQHLPINIVPTTFFNHERNEMTAQRCATVVEDDTNADIAVINSSAYSPAFRRLKPTNRVTTPRDELGERMSPYAIEDGYGDIEWLDNGQNIQTQKSFLTMLYTLNGTISEEASLLDVFYGLLFVAFRGYLDFDREGRIVIENRKPSPNAYVRIDTGAEQEPANFLPVTNAAKLFITEGYVLVGVGQPKSEVRKVTGIKYVNGSSEIEVDVFTSGTLSATYNTRFQETGGGQSYIRIDFSGTPNVGGKIGLKFTEPLRDEISPNVLYWDYITEETSLEDAVIMFRTRLEASISFTEFWSTELTPDKKGLIIKCQTGYLILDKPLKYPHYAGDEILHVVEVYENKHDDQYDDGFVDNIYSFQIEQLSEYQGVKSKFISIAHDFTETNILPRVAWDNAIEERNLNLLELDLRFCGNYRQAAYVTKGVQIETIYGFPAKLETWRLAMLHQQDDVVAVRARTLEGMSYVPFVVTQVSVDTKITLGLQLYFSAAYDQRIAQQEKFVESFAVNTNTPAPETVGSSGGFSTTRTGGGNSDSIQNPKFNPKPYTVLPERFHTDGSDKV